MRGSSVAIASTNGASPTDAATAAGIVASVPSRGTPSGITTSRPEERSPGTEDLFDLLGDELRTGVDGHAARDRARTSGTSARTSGVHSSG